MYCPRCRDEFREGFTRCDGCNVDLVHDLAEVEQEAAAAPNFPVQMAEYCGFLALEDARHSRDTLRGLGIRCEIVIRETLGSDLSARIEEEFWLRVDSSRVKDAAAALEESAGGGS